MSSILWMTLCFLAFHFADAAPVEKSRKFSCKIDVRLELKSGEVKEKTYSVPAANAKDCEKKSKLFETNYSSHRIQTKRVRFTWKGTP